MRIKKVSDKLVNFREIFKRPDFSYISDPSHIQEISQVILSCSTVEKEMIGEQLRKLRDFYSNASDFYEWANGSRIPSMRIGFGMIDETFSHTRNILNDANRQNVSRGYLNKFEKTFLKGLFRIADGAKMFFDPDLIGETRVETGQLARYILDNAEGLGRRYIFNDKGEHAFANKIDKLNLHDQKEVEWLLLNPGNARRARKFIDLGRGHGHPRILIDGKLRFFGRNRVMYLFGSNEHNEYSRFLDSQ